jgi:hypothetical protein
LKWLCFTPPIFVVGGRPRLPTSVLSWWTGTATTHNEDQTVRQMALFHTADFSIPDVS